jgi:hypothetical protein
MLSMGLVYVLFGQECDLVIAEDELVDLTELAYGDKWRGMLPSAGGCDEFLRLYMFRREVERGVLTELEGRLTGLREEGERIKLHIVPLQEAWKLSPDAKLLSCLTLYEKLKESKQLPGPKLNVAPTSLHEITGQMHELTAHVATEAELKRARSGSETSETPSRSSSFHTGSTADSVLTAASRRHTGRLGKGTTKLSSRKLMKQLSIDSVAMEERIQTMQKRIDQLELENAELKGSRGSTLGLSEEVDTAPDMETASANPD